MKLKLEVIKIGMIFRFRDEIMNGIISNITFTYPFSTLEYKINRMLKWKD